MADDHLDNWLDSLDLTGPAAHFATFCKTELERRRNTDPDYDPEHYEEAIRLVLRKLGSLDTEGLR